MYCKECGSQYKNNTATLCLECGVRKGNGKNYCDNCGELKKCENQDVCLNCGKDFKKSFIIKSKNEKNKLVALILWFLFGTLGIHHFYVGNKNKGISYICMTCAGMVTCGITNLVVVVWLIVDLINILTDKFTDGRGYAITQWI